MNPEAQRSFAGWTDRPHNPKFKPLQNNFRLQKTILFDNLQKFRTENRPRKKMGNPIGYLFPKPPTFPSPWLKWLPGLGLNQRPSD